MNKNKIMLLNDKTSLVQKEFYIFVDQYSPIAVLNLKNTKCFISAAYGYCSLNTNFLNKYLEGNVNYLPFGTHEKDLPIISPYCLSAIKDYMVEYDAELCRKNYYPKYPSRLSAIFAFGDYETCKKVDGKYGWGLSTVKKFRLNIDNLTRVIKVNMEIVSLMRTAYILGFFDDKTKDDIWKNYWNGTGDIVLELPDVESERKIYRSSEIFEYLIEGKLVLIESD
ncbi:hypothetical protein ES705_12618 [subsurface metagenome]